ncbi:hypothetical protein ACVWXO_001606 [Bradyrhizobium sp. LM2.7]
MTMTLPSELPYDDPGAMRRHLISSANFIATLALLNPPAWAQAEKELKTKSGVPVIIVNLVAPRPDCSSNPGTIAVPVIREKPTNGNIQMQVVVTDIAASQNCPARKIPSVALVYAPAKDFIGTDSVQVEIEAGNRTTTLRYRVTVQASAERL